MKLRPSCGTYKAEEDNGSPKKQWWEQGSSSLPGGMDSKKEKNKFLRLVSEKKIF